MNIRSTSWKSISLFLVGGILSFAVSMAFFPASHMAVAGYEHCSNTVDDDADSLVDCLDVIDCALATNCREDCFNGLDDDGDGAVDCDDLHCLWTEPACW